MLSELYYNNPHRFSLSLHTSNFILLILQQCYSIFPIFSLKLFFWYSYSLIYLFLISISFVLFLSAHVCSILIHFIPLLSFLLSNLFVNNMLLSVTFFPAFHLLFVLITQFRLHETFPSLIMLSFSQYLFFSIFLSTSHFSICLLFVLPDLFSLH